jgi:hypothetical protein
MSQKQPIRILIADDHPVVRAGLAAIARDCQSAVGDTTRLQVIEAPK